MADFSPILVLALGNGCASIATQAGELQGDVPQERRVVVEIAAPEPAWVLEKAMQPMQAGALDPRCAVADSAGVEIKGSPNAEHEARIELWQVTGHEELLLGTAEADPENVGFAFGDGRDEIRDGRSRRG